MGQPRRDGGARVVEGQGPPQEPRQLRRQPDPEAWPRITQALLDRGYDEAAIRGILGENFLRVAGQVWR